MKSCIMHKTLRIFSDVGLYKLFILIQMYNNKKQLIYHFLQGGTYLVNLFDNCAAYYAILFVVLFETLAVAWLYGNTLTYPFSLILLIFYSYVVKFVGNTVN